MTTIFVACIIIVGGESDSIATEMLYKLPCLAAMVGIVFYARWRERSQHADR